MAKVLPWSTCNNDWNTLGTRAACIITEDCFELLCCIHSYIYIKNSNLKLTTDFG